ncbi:MAG TPA: hypothetical protein VES97_02430 [Solirubrobacteraceae bacterium]|nr:hypothetical protein [Solirubrobacteraceae bacterium]
MAHILVQTNGRRTVLDEHDVELVDVDDEKSAADLLERLRRAVRDAEPRPGRRSRPVVRRLASIVPATYYRDVCG